MRWLGVISAGPIMTDMSCLSNLMIQSIENLIEILKLQLYIIMALSNLYCWLQTWLILVKPVSLVRWRLISQLQRFKCGESPLIFKLTLINWAQNIRCCLTESISLTLQDFKHNIPLELLFILDSAKLGTFFTLVTKIDLVWIFRNHEVLDEFVA